MARLFGTDGVRGVANTELTSELAFKLGKFGAHVITNGKKGAKIIIGRDTRISGDMLESAIVAGILSTGCDVVKLGIVPTPAISKLVKHFEADAGVMISASHNPVEYNGIKFFNAQGLKLKDEVEDEIEAYVNGKKSLEHMPVGNQLGRKTETYQGVKLYAEFILDIFKNLSLDGYKVAMDCANGSAYETAPMVISDLGASIYPIHHEPDGLNINEKCGSTHPEYLQTFTAMIKADIGLAFDGDADRLIAIDEKGDIVDGDKIMGICAKHYKEKGLLKDNVLVTTVMSNIGLDRALEKEDIVSVKTQVGDRYVLETMLENNYTIGGEQSGHIIFLNHNTTGDGLLSAVQLLEVMKETGKPLSELADSIVKYPQVLKNAKVPNDKKHTFMENKKIATKITEVEEAFHGEGRVLIRPSGTEPLVRVMIEGNDDEKLELYASELVTLIETVLV